MKINLLASVFPLFISSVMCSMLVSCGGDSISDIPPSAAQEKALSQVQKTADAAAYANVVQALYISYFCRPADPLGLANLEIALQKAGAPTQINALSDAYET